MNNCFSIDKVIFSRTGMDYAFFVEHEEIGLGVIFNRVVINAQSDNKIRLDLQEGNPLENVSYVEIPRNRLRDLITGFINMGICCTACEYDGGGLDQEIKRMILEYLNPHQTKEGEPNPMDFKFKPGDTFYYLGCDLILHSGVVADITTNYDGHVFLWDKSGYARNPQHVHPTKIKAIEAKIAALEHTHKNRIEELKRMINDHN